jgi:hypothetical protein
MLDYFLTGPGQAFTRLIIYLVAFLAFVGLNAAYLVLGSSAGPVPTRSAPPASSSPSSTA